MSETKTSASILVVDDTLKNIQVLGTILRKEGHQIHVAQNGDQALKVAQTTPLDLILLDVMMPVMNGFEACEKLKESPQTKDVPVIFLTARTETEDIVKGFELGAVDYVTKPFNSTELLVRVNTHLSLHFLQRNLEQRVMERTAELAQSQLETVYRLGVAAEYRDEDTGVHIQRMRHYSSLLAMKLDLSDEEVALILNASPMHDVGKIGISDTILLKPDKLTDEEHDIIKQHTLIGSGILSGSSSELLNAGEVIALSHHEKWDGSGYPNGLAGEDIPLWGRICAVADVYDALTSKRPYKKAFPNEEALEIMKEGRGKHFDPKILDLFVENFSEIVAIQKEVGN